MPEEDIKLFQHNEEAYKKLVKSLDDYPLAFIEHATGTGKSLIILKYLYVKMREMRIFFVTLHDEMFDQLFGKQMKMLGMKREDFNKFETLIYYNLVKQDPKDIVDNYDCIVFDEAHHCGAPKWSKIVEGIKEEVLKRKDKKMIGLTATGIRYLDNYLDVCEKYFDGHLVSKLNVVDAMLRELLPTPLYINSIVSCKSKYEQVMHKLQKMPRTKEIIDLMDKMKKIGKRIDDNSSVSDLLKKYDVKTGEKYIVFCKNIKDLEKKKEEAKEWFKDIGPVKMFEAHSGQKKQKNHEQINEFEQKRDEVSLMFAVDIFNEGFHIDDLDGILMFRETTSPIVYLQQIGRALSFSARKKQIKIFDFVDNISDNDVIRELYKELVSEAKRLMREEPEKRELFEEIIKRFEIVDYTSSTIETLDEIETYLDENFTFRNSIIRAISKLQQYRDTFPSNDIQYDIKNGKLDIEYLKAYEHIKAMDRYLTLENIEVLNNLKIDFNGEILMDIEKRRELLAGHNNYEELEVARFNKFRSDYIQFMADFNRRPVMGNSKEEDHLFSEYRKYLGTLSKKDLMNLFNKFDFKLTVEELVLTGNYPTKDELYEYFSVMVKRLGECLGFDRAELKVLKKVKALIPMEFFQLKEYLDHNKDVGVLLDAAIKVLKRYELNKKEFQSNGYSSFVTPNELLKAQRVLKKYALYVNNEQFKELLETDIELPRSINMSWEERLEKLGSYNSFYEKEMDKETSVISNYFSFIVKNNRRPDENNPSERDLATAYDDFLLFTSVSKIKIICASLEHYEMPHSFLEKVLLGEKIPEIEINDYINTLLEKKKKNKYLTSRELKILRFIFNKQKFGQSVEVTNLLKVQTVYQQIWNLIEKYERFKDSASYNRLLFFLKNNNEYVTVEILNKLKSIDITFSREFEQIVRNLGEYSSIKEKKLAEKSKMLISLEKYVYDNKKRPDVGSDLDKQYRKKLAKMTKSDIKEFLRIFKKNNISFTPLERILLEIATRDEILSYLNDLDSKVVEQNYSLDELDKRVINKLNHNGLLSDYPRLMKLLPNYHQQITVEDRIVREIDEKLTANPNIEIDFDAYSLNVSSKKLAKLETKRMNLILQNFFKRLLYIMHTNNCSLMAGLDNEDKEKYQIYIEYKSMNPDTRELLEEVKAVDRYYRALENESYKEALLKNYVDFIYNHKGQKPNYASEDMEELELARQFDSMKEYFTRNDVILIETAIRESEKVNSEEFYQQYVNFILSKGRMPCGNSDDPYEVKLNNLYLNINNSFTKNQSAEIKKLKKTYNKATIEATISFGKRKESEKNDRKKKSSD